MKLLIQFANAMIKAFVFIGIMWIGLLSFLFISLLNTILIWTPLSFLCYVMPFLAYFVFGSIIVFGISEYRKMCLVGSSNE